MSKKTVSIILTTSLLLGTSVMPVFAATNEAVQKPIDSYQQTMISTNANENDSKQSIIYVYDGKKYREETHIEWNSKPTKTNYVLGKDTELDLSGGKIEITVGYYEIDESSETSQDESEYVELKVNPDNISTALSIVPLKSEWCSGFDPTKSGVQTITVNYPEAISPLTFDITVQAAETSNETTTTDNNVTDNNTNTNTNPTTTSTSSGSKSSTEAKTNSNSKASVKTGVYRKTFFDYFLK